MALPSPVLTWTSLTKNVNLIKKPGGFLGQIMRVTEETLPTETIEIGTLRGERDVAPFVRVGAEAEMVGGLGEEMFTVQAPNIRIKRPFRPSELLFGRRAGTTVFPTEGEVISAVEQHVARDMNYMNDMILNAEEWLAAMALRAAVSYSVADREVYTATFARAGAHSITPSVFWNDATPANITAVASIRAITSLVAEAVGMGVTDAIMGSEVTPYFLKLPELVASINTQSGFNSGSVDLTQKWREDGAIFIGRWLGINWWEYPRTLRIDGVATALIRAKYVEFICSTPAAEMTRYYGAIPDMDALEGRTMQAKRFAKSWKQPDPSAMIALLHSRPLVVPRIPDSTVSFKAISG